jgi:phosphate transport system ATP-binding protein
MLLEATSPPARERERANASERADARRLHADRETRRTDAVREIQEPPAERSPEQARGENRSDGVQVPPVRTIVLDRPPVAVAPPVRERNPLREPLPSTAGPERLHLNELSVAYSGKPAVKSVSLSVHQGEVLALIGPSGCGKTTLLRTLNRLTELTPSAARSGQVLLDGEDIHDLVDTTLRARIAMVFQQPNPFPMSIFDNVAFALREQSRKRPRKRELEPLVIDALRRAGLYDEVRDDLDRPALRLSGGQQQRLCC